MAIPKKTVATLENDRQSTRILRLFFPHQDGPQAVLLANKFMGTEGISLDYKFTVEVLADRATIPLSEVQGKMVSIELVRDDGSLRYFNGYVFEFRLVRTDGGIAFYSMVLRPWMAYLKMRVDNYIFHEMTLIDQTTDIFRDYAGHASWDCRITSVSADPSMSMAIQYGESDHNYLNRRWEDAGWHYWYEHTADGHKLILSDNSRQAAPIDGATPEIRFHRAAGSQEDDAIAEWSPVRNIAVSSVALSASDFKRPRMLQTEAPTLNKQGKVIPIEFYEYTGSYGFRGGNGSSLADLRMEEIEARAKHFEASGNVRMVSPHRWFRFTDNFHFPSPENAGGSTKNEFLITSVKHTISNNYLQNIDTPAEYSNELRCIRKSIRWRPGRGHNSVATKIYAPQTAIVVAQADENMLTDALGRVWIQFPWDRKGERNKRSSAPVRVLNSLAGAELGFSSVPRQGMEVVVQWLDGNPDHPIVVGCVPNVNNMPPWKLPAQQALSGMRSRELAPGAGNVPVGRSNHLVLDDTLGKIQAQLKSDHQHSQLSLGHITRIEDSLGRKEDRGEGFALETGGAGAMRASKGLLLTTDGRAEAVGGILSRTELIYCLQKALDVAQGLGEAAAQHQGGKRDTKPQQALTEAVDALGHGTGHEASTTGAGASGQPVIALSGEAGIASATPNDQTHYAGQNIDMIAGQNQQNYAAKSILNTAGKDIEQFSLDGDISLIANKGKIIQQAQHNAIEITADKSVSIMSTDDHILMAAEKHITLTSGGAYIKLSGGNIDVACPGTLTFRSAARSFIGPASMAAHMPTFDTGATGRKFSLHRDGDRLDKVVDHHYRIELDNGEVIEGVTGEDGLTQLAEKDVMRIAKIKVWKEPK